MHINTQPPTTSGQVLQHQIQMARRHPVVTGLPAGSLECSAAYGFLDFFTDVTDFTKANVRKARSHVRSRLTENMHIPNDKFAQIRAGLDAAQHALYSQRTGLLTGN